MSTNVTSLTLRVEQPNFLKQGISIPVHANIASFAGSTVEDLLSLSLVSRAFRDAIMGFEGSIESQKLYYDTGLPISWNGIQDVKSTDILPSDEIEKRKHARFNAFRYIASTKGLKVRDHLIAKSDIFKTIPLKDGLNPLQWAVLNPSRIPYVKRLVDFECLRNEVDGNGETALQLAVKVQNLEAVKLLVKIENVNHQNKDGQTPLYQLTRMSDLNRMSYEPKKIDNKIYDVLVQSGALFKYTSVLPGNKIVSLVPENTSNVADFSTHRRIENGVIVLLPSLVTTCSLLLQRKLERHFAFWLKASLAGFMIILGRWRSELQREVDPFEAAYMRHRSLNEKICNGSFYFLHKWNRIGPPLVSLIDCLALQLSEFRK